MTSAAPLSVVFSLLSQRKEGAAWAMFKRGTKLIIYTVWFILIDVNQTQGFDEPRIRSIFRGKTNRSRWLVANFTKNRSFLGWNTLRKIETLIRHCFVGWRPIIQSVIQGLTIQLWVTWVHFQVIVLWNWTYPLSVVPSLVSTTSVLFDAMTEIL